VSLILLTGISLGKTLPVQSNDQLVRSKSNPVVSQGAMNYMLSKSGDGTTKIWVFFTDRGFDSYDEFSRAAQSASSRITERALARRTKVDRDKISITDIPVNAAYVNAITSLGATPRRTSRYLNAASFEVPISVIDKISDMDFVAEIRPMLGFKKDYSKVEDSSPSDKSGSSISLDTDTLSYGASYDQLDQINVIAAHEAGYNGSGVLVAMFDTGFRKTHRVFLNIAMSGRLIAEWDFVFDDGNTSNEAEDWSSAWNHGTLTWSTLGGEWADNHYGPAYGADFIIAKTEDVRSETPVEEDNWLAAVEWADSIGADVISSSLGYTDWYTAPDYDGNTAVVTLAAEMAMANGIVVCNSAGNDGPGSATINTPTDADSIISVGAVYSSGTIVGFSSRGPTYDGRIKPEVCARGSGTACASSSGDEVLTTASGTSLSCPLVGGVAALVLEAHPDWTPMQVREALMMTASNSTTPDNNYGWGIVDTWAAINYSFGPSFIPGDANESGGVDIDDVVYLIGYIFSGGPPPVPHEDAGDADGSGSVDIDDVTYLINYIFSGGLPPVGT